jgi:hypothetical protein
MTVRGRVWLTLVALVVVAAAATAGYFVLRTRERSLPPAPVTRVPASWQDVRTGEGHVVHVQQAGIACEQCHGASATMQAPSVSVCRSCHASQAKMRHALDDALALGAASGDDLADCLACHGFAASAPQSPWQCLRCHEEPQGAHAAIAEGAHDDCAVCHRPHEEPAIQPKACRDCHVSADNAHGGLPMEDGKNCLACHDAHGSAALANERCSNCHEQSEAIFVGHDRCAGCHVPHAFSKSDVASCTSCHAGQHTLAEAEAPAHRRCTSCHDPHAPKRADDGTCKGCHAKIAPTHPAVDGHDCVSCHAPHAGAPLQGKATHAASVTHDASSVQARRGPIASHQPCTSCHALAADDRAAHGGKADCTACHAPHAFAPPAATATCADCHRSQLASLARNPGHAKPTAGEKTPCASCHRGHPHEASMPPAQCSTCHTDVHPRPEHAQCSACHVPHAGTPRAQAESCQSCHAEQHAQAIPAHRECRTCHEPHTGRSLAKASCRSCHATQAKQGHGKLDLDCLECHAVHTGTGAGKALLGTAAAHGSPAKKACTQCHAPSKLGGLHQVQKHQTCSSCHGGAHDPGPWSERQTCVSCHRDRERHAPEAALCQGCHVFKP